MTSLTPLNLNQRNSPAVIFLMMILWLNQIIDMVSEQNKDDERFECRAIFVHNEPSKMYNVDILW